MGVANILEAARGISSVRAVVVVTTDKCYENMEIEHSYKESDRLGGHDPYSASKACAELVTACFRRSYTADSATLIASARAGNVVGGGDWTADRLIPDAVRSASAGKNMVLRSPNSSRPWQHVLEPLSGYLSLGQRLLEGESELAGAWNFGPKPDSNLTTREVLALAQSYWPAIRPEEVPQPNAPHEAGLLMVDSSKANQLLEWFPVWDLDSTLKKTIEWYIHYYSTHREILTALQIEEYCIDANETGAIWAKN
jgi:CDP-glucose 4,6-dehydratase